MRDIEFRAWDGSTMEYGVDVVGGKPHTSRVGYFELYSDREIEGGILMQFTGLRDKNGKKIWEGDVVKTPYPFLAPVGQIVWADHLAAFVCATENPLYRLAATGAMCDGEVEVIGNIHENPELLK